MAFTGQTVTFVGDGVAVNKELICEKMGNNAVFALPHLTCGRAASVAQLAYEKALNGDTVSYSELMPFYLRAPQAEREKSK